MLRTAPLAATPEGGGAAAPGGETDRLLAMERRIAAMDRRTRAFEAAERKTHSYATYSIVAIAVAWMCLVITLLIGGTVLAREAGNLASQAQALVAEAQAQIDAFKAEAMDMLNASSTAVYEDVHHMRELMDEWNLMFE